MHTPIERNEVNGGTQDVYQFPNGYGASVVRHEFSYGGPEGKYELAVLRFLGYGERTLTYDTPITDDVIGWLSDDEVQKTLSDIAALPEAV